MGTTLPSCDEEPLPRICPSISAGDLVITEIRGDQSSGQFNPSGQWIEIHNASSNAIDLEGLTIRVRKTDGTAPSGEFPGRMIVRHPNVIEPGDYFVVGTGPYGDPFVTTDYAVGGDFDGGNMPGAGIIDLLACDEVIDNLRYSGLPNPGTLTLDGSISPTADANDLPINWCPDETLASVPSDAGDAPGSPGQQNPPCVDDGM